MNHFKKGLYRHFKGNFYEVIDVVRSSETLEPLILYRSLYGDFGLWVRPYEMFFENVEHNGESKNRFEFISSEVPRDLQAPSKL